jgi:hypothetical protein
VHEDRVPPGAAAAAAAAPGTRPRRASRLQGKRLAAAMGITQLTLPFRYGWRLLDRSTCGQCITCPEAPLLCLEAFLSRHDVASGILDAVVIWISLCLEPSLLCTKACL